jgi:hypothetical protein
LKFSSGNNDCEFQLWNEPEDASMVVQALEG